MIPAEEVKVLDKNAQYLGVPTSQLMENAGKAVADVMIKRLKLSGKKVLVLCGLGNNGGDGFVAARYLRAHCDVTVVLLGDENSIKSDIARLNFTKVKVRVRTVLMPKNINELINDSDIIVDAMLGIGVTGKLKEPYLGIVNHLNSLKGKDIIAVDVPTGTGTDKVLKSTLTVTFHKMKDNMDKKFCGKIVVEDIGIPEDADIYVGPGELLYIPEPLANARKGDRGKVLIIGGGPYTGAPALAAMAALKAGIDIVYIAAPRRCADIIASYSPNMITVPLEGDIYTREHVDLIKKYLTKVGAVLIGPGLGDDPETRKACAEFFKICKMAVVIDADAIRAAGENRKSISKLEGIITPHSGEFYELTREKLPQNVDDASEKVKKWAKKIRMTLLVKGPTDIITNGKYVKFNRTGNSSMSTGGTGDILAGLCAAFLAKRISPYNSARISAFVCGCAGDLAYSNYGHSTTATDVVNCISEVMAEYVEWWRTRKE